MRKSRVLIQSKIGADRTECAMHARARVGYSEQVHKGVVRVVGPALFARPVKALELERGKRRKAEFLTKKRQKRESERRMVEIEF